MITTVSCSNKWLLIISITLSTVLIRCSTTPSVSPVQILHEYDTSKINHGLNNKLSTVDIVILRHHQSEISWESFKEEIASARQTFAEHGVQIHLQKAYEVDFPNSWHGLSTKKRTRIPAEGTSLDFYEKYDTIPNRLPQKMKSTLKQLLAITTPSPRTIYFVTLKGLITSWLERSPNGQWKEVSSPTAALSFPTYGYTNLAEQHYRGIISFERSKPLRKTMAHELGHKLINVSHEGLNKCPQGDGGNIPGLMGYGRSMKIYSGKKGRWHKERLLKSPFLYRVVDGQKVWNPDYKAGGIYADPIYGDYIIQPACPPRK